MIDLNEEQLAQAFEILSTAKCQLNYEDYQAIFGTLAEHIWRQEGSDLLRIWRSGITIEQKKKLVTHILNREFKAMDEMTEEIKDEKARELAQEYDDDEEEEGEE